MSRSKSILAAIFYGPIFWGCLVSIGFYAAIHQKHISNPMVQRYFAGKSVEYVTTVLFFVALAAIVIKLIELVLEPRVGTDLWLDPIPDEKQPPEDAGSLLAQMASWPSKLRHSLLGRRLHDALESVQRHNSAEKLDEELHAMADTAAGDAHAKMALVRTIISCIPVLGFLGTVIGITEAVAHLSAVIKNVAFDKAVEVLGAKLGEGFDATALALALSMVLMFMLFFVNYLETRLLSSVEVQANRELVGRFQTATEDHDPNVAVVRRMADEVIESTERLVSRQTELWTETVGAAQKRWAGQAVSTERQLETALGNALRSSLETHAQHLKKSEESMAEAGRQQWQQAIAALERTTAALTAQQAELQQQGRVMREAVDATGRVMQLEDALNRNLAALSGNHNFEQTLMSLSAAVNLLGARLSQPAAAPRRVDLRTNRPTEKAA